jgi:hypothetical protein
MSPSTTSLAVPGATGASANPRVVRATSPAKSRLTIRLPDLSSSRLTVAAQAKANVAPAATGQVGPEMPPDDQHRGTATYAVSTEQAASTALAKLAVSSGGLPQKILTFVRQPKFWLACIVAVVVQVVLAFVMTPVEQDSDRDARPKHAAKPSEASPEPAAHIVVPAAPVNVADEPNQPPPTATTPMGLTLPVDTATDATSTGDEELSAERFPETRMAENRPLVEAKARFDGRSTGGPDGATLGGISPVEPAPPQ